MVKVAREEEVSGVISMVMDLQRAPAVVVMIGDDWASSMGDLPLDWIQLRPTLSDAIRTGIGRRPVC